MRQKGSDLSSYKIERIVAGGWGLTHIESKVMFVRGVLPDELVTITPEASQKGYQFATLDKVKEVSPDRITAPCPVYEQCGGCQFQHVRYEAQLRYKQQMLEEAVAKLRTEVDERTVRQVVKMEFAGFEGDGDEEHEY